LVFLVPFFLSIKIEIISLKVPELNDLLVNQPRLVVKYSKLATAGDGPKPRAGMSLVTYFPPAQIQNGHFFDKNDKSGDLSKNFEKGEKNDKNSSGSSFRSNSPLLHQQPLGSNSSAVLPALPLPTIPSIGKLQQEQQQQQQHNDDKNVEKNNNDKTLISKPSTRPQSSQTHPNTNPQSKTATIVICIGGTDQTTSSKEIFILDTAFGHPFPGQNSETDNDDKIGKNEPNFQPNNSTNTTTSQSLPNPPPSSHTLLHQPLPHLQTQIGTPGGGGGDVLAQNGLNASPKNQITVTLQSNNNS